jgi:hypothetical protein
MRHVACIEQLANAHKIVLWKPEGIRSLAIYISGGRGNFKMDLMDIR